MNLWFWMSNTCVGISIDGEKSQRWLYWCNMHMMKRMDTDITIDTRRRRDEMRPKPKKVE
jgi:hypothetical protein